MFLHWLRKQSQNNDNLETGWSMAVWFFYYLCDTRIKIMNEKLAAACMAYCFHKELVNHLLRMNT